MKTIQKIMLTALLIVSCNFVTMSQNLDEMSEAKRDSILIAAAKEVVLKYGPGYYREYKAPVIERGQIPPKGEINTTGENANRVYYRVIFLYDNTKEHLENDFAARVGFWADDGKASGIFFGNGWIRPVPDNEDWRNDTTIVPTPYQPREIFPLYDWQHGKTEVNSDPINMDELKKKGFVKKADGQWERTRPDMPPAEALEVLKREGYEEKNGRLAKIRTVESAVKD